MILQKDCYTLCIRKGEEVQSLKLEIGHYLSLFYSTTDLFLAFDYLYSLLHDFILTNGSKNDNKSK